jgi:hypothetical protein
LGIQAEAGESDGLSRGWEVGNNVVGYKIVGDGDGSKGIQLGKREGGKWKVANVKKCVYV